MSNRRCLCLAPLGEGMVGGMCESGHILLFDSLTKSLLEVVSPLLEIMETSSVVLSSPNSVETSSVVLPSSKSTPVLYSQEKIAETDRILTQSFDNPPPLL